MKLNLKKLIVPALIAGLKGVRKLVDKAIDRWEAKGEDAIKKINQ